MLRWTLLALTGALATPLPLYALWEAMPGARQVVSPPGLFFLILGVGVFVLLPRDIARGTSGAK